MATVGTTESASVKTPYLPPHRRNGDGKPLVSQMPDTVQRQMSSRNSDSIRPPLQNNNRWKECDAIPRTDSQRSNNGRRPMGGPVPQNSNGIRRLGSSRVSKTGTNWDVRDGRHWSEENATEIFKMDADKSTGINFDSYDAIPVDISGKGSELLVPIQSFTETALTHELMAANIARVRYERPTPVQKYSIAVVLAGHDLMACAQTGSGKTAAFLFPLIIKLLSNGPPGPHPSQRSGYDRVAYPVALILSPTRELTLQIFEESRKFAFKTGINTVVIFGGGDMASQIKLLSAGCDICVATPGRLTDFVTRSKICLSLVKYLVLDEADRMLDMGFMPQICDIVECHGMPSSDEGRQTVMFSATFPTPIQKLAGEFLKDYIFLSVGRVGSTSEFIDQRLLFANEPDKPTKLIQILESCRNQLVLVFVETKRKVGMIESFLRSRNYGAVCLHGDMSQEERMRSLNDFRSGRSSIMVATDVASRGLDIHNIAHVVNLDLPKKVDDYVHRIGRTGRAGNKGRATSFVNDGDKDVLRDLLGILEESNQEVPKWFHDMVRCSYASRSGFGGGGSMYGKNRKLNSNSFGGRDVRNNNNFGNNNSISRNNNESRPTKPSATATRDDEDDGWLV